MTVLRTDIERALDELASEEEGMRFQGLAVVLGKKRWPELIAHQRKKDLGLDAYAPASLSSDGVGKGLAASITPTLRKISTDAETAKKNFPDLSALIFVTSAKVGNSDRKSWEAKIQKDHGIELYILDREEIITQMRMPENASLSRSFLHLATDAEADVADLIDKTKRAAATVTQAWERKTKGNPLIELQAIQLDPHGVESTTVLSLDEINEALSHSRRIVLEGPAGRGKTTTLIQLAQRARVAGTPFIIELPAWTSSRRSILEYIAGIPAFQAEGLTPADLARVQQTEPFLFLLNGWNEIAESTSVQADNAIRELERDFPSAGIIVATRVHHLKPPLPGAIWLRLLRLHREQRTVYLTARLGAKDTVLRARINEDPALDELTRTPFILSEVASLFEADAEIPSTRIGVLDQVVRLQEQREEHRNALRAAPLFHRQQDYLKALATVMTRSGAAAIAEADARTTTATVTQELADRGQVDPIGAPTILTTLTAHHILERVDYPQTAFQFQHQQFQEYYAAVDVRARVFELCDDNQDEASRFVSDYVNDPAWAEPLRMIAEAFAEETNNEDENSRNLHAARRLVEMALAVDPVFAGELVRLCGASVWNEVRTLVGERLRAIRATPEENFQEYALAAMLATGADDFADIIEPLLSGPDQQTRLHTYRLCPDFQVSSLGPTWREQVSHWSIEAREDFVSEILHERADNEVVSFAVSDPSAVVKKAAASALMWTRSDDALTRVLDTMDAQTFQEVTRNHADLIPAELRPATITAMKNFIDNSGDPPARLRTALDLIELGETDLEGVVKDAMSTLSGDTLRKLGSHLVEPALQYMCRVDPVWTSDWVATQVAEGILYGHEYWLQFAPVISDDVVEEYLQRIGTQDLGRKVFEGMIAVIVVRTDPDLAARVFVEIRDLQSKMDAEPEKRQEFEWQVKRQLEALFRQFPGDVAAAGILSSATSDDPLDVKVATDLLSRVARPDMEPLSITDDDLKARLRVYLKNSVDLVLRQDDFNGEEKADLASAIAQVGKPEDITILVTLIRADIERVRRGRAARAAGNHGPLANGGSMSHTHWHIAAVAHLDTDGAEQVLIGLLSEPEYLPDAAAEMARDYVPKPKETFGQTVPYDLIWAAREGRAPSPSNESRRTRFAAALNAEIQRLRSGDHDGQPAALKVLAKALAAVDGRGSAATVLDIVAVPGRWDHFTRLETAELLLLAGVILPASTTLALVDSLIERAENWMQESDNHLLCRALALCPFVDDPLIGFTKVRDVLNKRPLPGYDLRGLVTALGQSRSDAAVDLLYYLASDAATFAHCADRFIEAVAALDTPRSRDLLLHFVDPDIRTFKLTHRLDRENLLVAHIAEIAGNSPEVAARLRELCERDLPELDRYILSKVMSWLGTSEALAANLNLIDDAMPSPVPQGIWDQLENAVVERRPYGQSTNVFTQHARASNDLRAWLFRIAVEDRKRQKSAFMLLGRIEVWRLEHGRPIGEPRHPDLASGNPWPPKDPDLSP